MDLTSYRDPENVPDEWYIERMRIQRDRLLSASDWTALPDNELTEEQRQAWAEYRSALRHFPETWEPGPTADFPDPPEA